MIFADFITDVATLLDTTSTNAGVFMALFVTLIIMLLLALASRGDMRLPLVSTVLMIVLFTMMEWLPTWTGGALAVGLSLVSALVISQTGES